MAYKSSPRGSRAVSLVAVHTAEGARTATNLGAYFFRPDIQASSHVGIDGGNTLQYVGYDRAAWTLRSGNPISDNAELCGFARWTRDQWMSTGVVDGVTNPRAILDRTAAWIRSRCLARGIPIRKIGPADVAAGRPGVIGHYDWTIGARDGSHTDPGSNFPWDYVINKANDGEDDEMGDRQNKQLDKIHEQLMGTADPDKGWPGFPSLEFPQSRATPVDFIRAMDQGLIRLRRVADSMNGTVGALSAKLDTVAAGQRDTNARLDKLIDLLTPKSGS